MVMSGSQRRTGAGWRLHILAIVPVLVRLLEAGRRGARRQSSPTSSESDGLVDDQIGRETIRDARKCGRCSATDNAVDRHVVAGRTYDAIVVAWALRARQPCPHPRIDTASKRSR
jgi:hypothetical protein